MVGAAELVPRKVTKSLTRCYLLLKIEIVLVRSL